VLSPSTQVSFFVAGGEKDEWMASPVMVPSAPIGQRPACALLHHDLPGFFVANRKRLLSVPTDPVLEVGPVRVEFTSGVDRWAKA
jgi:hypothetical protein